MFCKFWITACLVHFFYIAVSAQTQPKIGLHIGAGWQDDPLILRPSNSISFPGWNYEIPYYNNPFFETGPAIQINRLSIVIAARLMGGNTNPLAQREPVFKATLSPNLYAKYYFGKHDNRGYSIGWHSSIVNYPIIVVEFPDDPDRVPRPGYPKNSTHFLNGLEAATRVIRRGVLANTYLGVSWQVAPPSQLDRFVLIPNNIWSKRLQIGLHCVVGSKQHKKENYE